MSKAQKQPYYALSAESAIHWPATITVSPVPKYAHWSGSKVTVKSVSLDDYDLTSIRALTYDLTLPFKLRSHQPCNALNQLMQRQIVRIQVNSVDIELFSVDIELSEITSALISLRNRMADAIASENPFWSRDIARHMAELLI